MSYPYTAENRLDAPHAYMYAPFGGAQFLGSYVADRRARLTSNFGIERTSVSTEQLRDAAWRLTGDDAPGLPALESMPSWSLRAVMHSLIRALSDGGDAQRVLDPLVQRFEVSKKLYRDYAPGFRNGQGSFRDPVRYIEFALCLVLAYRQSGHMQYLSTLLKLVDLILSIDPKEVLSACPRDVIALLVEAELEAVAKLATTHRVPIRAG